MWVEIGNQLRQGRESAGLSFEEIQSKMQIDTISLRALESGDFDKLGSPFTVRSYIRAYAKHVGLEPTYLLKHYRRLEQTGVMPAIDPEGFSNTNTHPPLSAPSPGHPQGTDQFQALPGASQEEEYDPFKNHPTRQTDPQEAAYDPYASTAFDDVSVPEQQIPSRSNAGSKRTGSKRTEALKLPALKKRNSGKHRTPEGGATDGAAYGDWTTPEPELRSFRQRRVITDRMVDDPYGDSDGGYHWDDDQNVGAWDDHEVAYGPDSAWEGYPETAAGVEEAAGWDDMEPLSRRSDRHAHSRQSSSGRLAATSSNEDESGWDLQTPSRSRSGRERSVIVSGPPALVDSHTDAGPPSRSGRRHVVDRGKKMSNWLTRKRWILVVAAVIVLIPVSVLAYNNIKGDSPDETAATKSNDGPTAAGDSSVGVASVISMNKTPSLGEYKLSEPDIVSFTFKAKGSSSWIQIREQQNPDDGYIKDFTLQPGEEYPYNHLEEASNDVWVTIGNPENITMTINGQEVDTTKSIHVTRE
ncbi:helix-turn-helix domain-containing protein [Desmospora profundinema]|uniref:Cytoskeletal protein RodZ n=1 Tax=Desmospora profundinema TaxID=1571184 RepID=A0ABU1ILW6_9BACL|nr:RodZ domain-containing protein [Desmospora profundinema]MDR6225763.1 cytoskeletal protein RodZ [Desmospora profundinema]